MPEKKSVKHTHELHAPLELSKTPKGVTVIEGFPGLGLVGTIVTGYLLDHLRTEKIGSYYFEEPPATIAVHGCKLIDPIGIYYNKEHNLVIVHAISSPVGMEYRAADLIIDLCNQVQAKEIISVEGVGSTETEAKTRGFYFTNNNHIEKKMKKLGITCLGEGIIVGVTAALLLRHDFPQLSLFAETHSKLPDSRAAAKIVELLDKYLGLKVDYKPLIKQAEEFEKKLKALFEQTKKAQTLKEQKKIGYIG